MRGTGRWSRSGLPQPSPVRLWMFSAPHTVRWSFLWPQRCAAGLVCPANPRAAILRVCGLEVGGSGAPADPTGTCRASRIAFFSPWLSPFFFPLLLVILEGMKIIQLLDLLYSVLQRCQKSLGQEERRGEASRNECAPRTAAFAHKRPGSQSSAWPEPAVLSGSPALPCNAPF